MSFNLAILQEALFKFPLIQVPQAVSDDPLMERIRQVLMAFTSTDKLQKPDIQPLIRHLLLRESSNSGQEIHLRVPATPAWPSITEWDNHGITAMPIGTDSYLLNALPWHPNWIGGGENGVFSDSFSIKKVRVNGKCAADPFVVDATNHEYYSCPGQREAIRAAFLIPPGDTLIVNLPTGSGKSLVGQAPALINGQPGLTLFVVPTVALAIDQERVMKEYLRNLATNNQTWPLAWYGGTSKEERSEIRKRMLDGTQRILFTSPEALTTSLLRTVFEVAKTGMLRYLVIDEAHLITQWGDEFRPAFQALAALRNSLLLKVAENNVEPFRTLLLSATFTPETTDTLANLFGPPSSVQMVAAVHLRPEPQYWFSRANSTEEKQKQVIEALMHSARPFILYVTTREEAKSWHDLLTNQLGLKRVERFDGKTLDQKRKSIIDEWGANKLDGIVATSAFGVGIDKQDVRTIIHATIPETLDRYYQEVGRGGRDGQRSVSLLVYCNSDWSIPSSMATPNLISNQLGFARWKAIYESRTEVDKQGSFRINLAAVRVGLPGSNDENVKWNMRTLQLMARAGFLQLEVEPSDHLEIENDEYSHSILATMSTIKVRLLKDNHLLPEAWENFVSQSRVKTLEGGMRNFGLLKKMLGEGREMSETLANLYRSNSLEFPVTVTRICGGCPSDRFLTNRESHYNVPIATPVSRVKLQFFDLWNSTFPYLAPKYVLVFYNQEQQTVEVTKLVRWLVSECGIQEVCAREGSLLEKSTEWRNLYKRSKSGVVIHRGHQQFEEEPYSPLARVTVFDSHVTGEQLRSTIEMSRPFHLVLCVTDTPDPNHPLRRLSDTAVNSARLEQLISVIHQ
jgi:hypothetical protein